jgi:hypothetical protein
MVYGDAMAECPRCFSNTLSRNEVRGHLEVLECATCGYVTGATVYYPLEALPNEVKYVVVRVRWKTGRATVPEIKALRDVFERFASISVSEVMTRFGSVPTFEVGEYPFGVANERKARGASLGLNVEVVSDVAPTEPMS